MKTYAELHAELTERSDIVSTPNLPADWDPTDPQTWVFQTTVDAFDGYHSSGAVYRRLIDIRHAATDYESRYELERQVAADAVPGDTAQWWSEVLEPIHQLACRLAELDPDTAAPILREALGLPEDADDEDIQRAMETDDLEAEAAQARRLLDALDAGSRHSR